MKPMFLPTIRSAADVAALVESLGFLPFFRNEIAGFSIEDCCPPELWFSSTAEGPWEWKGPVIRQADCAYGKFYRNKAMFISKSWFPAFANYRRDGYDYDARMDQGIARSRDYAIMQTLLEQKSDILSKHLKALSCPDRESRKSFDSSLTYLQMQGYITTTDFTYLRDKHGDVYGWGVARYATPELRFGEAFTAQVYAEEPAASYRRMLDYLTALLPQATEKQLLRLLG